MAQDAGPLSTTQGPTDDALHLPTTTGGCIIGDSTEDDSMEEAWYIPTPTGECIIVEGTEDHHRDNGAGPLSTRQQQQRTIVENNQTKA
jgi:hypothetical protein